MIGRAVTLLAVTVAAVLLCSEPLSAQSLSLDLADAGPSATGRVVQLLGLLKVPSLAPSILVMVTSFTRIIVVLSFLRTALGIQQMPPNQVLIVTGRSGPHRWFAGELRLVTYGVLLLGLQ